MGRHRKVIVIGLDGLEPSICESLLGQGRLPNLAKLVDRAGYSRLATTYPAQTPVAWSTFATGVNPGGHGIFDFLERDPQSYRPRLALNQFQQSTPFLPPKVINGRRGTPVWSLLTEAGIPSIVLRCPCTFPPDAIRGRLLSGMGVPDLRGGFGTSAFYSTAENLQSGESELTRHISIESQNQVQTVLLGPRHPKTGTELECPLLVHVDWSQRRIVIRSNGVPEKLEVAQGKWSDWLRIRFKLGLLTSMWGMVRFYLRSLEPHLEFYASPINFDVEAPAFPISSPPSYARELAASLGTFYTAGMPEDHNGLTNGRLDEAAYLDQCGQVLAERERMMLHELARLDEGLFFILFDTPDRIQHMFWRFRDPQHPANRGGSTDSWAAVIEEHYEVCDSIVGKALAFADDSTLCVVLSDHGFDTFRRAVNLNSWLHEQGLLALRPGTDLQHAGPIEQAQIDWTRTRAYAVGFGGIYWNLQGRESQGIVAADEAQDLGTTLIEKLGGLRDPESGAVAIPSALARSSLYSGPYADRSPDILVNFGRGFRASWSTALGGLGRDLFEDNLQRWSGDHIIHPLMVPGILFMNQPFRAQNPRMVDLAPTILEALGVPRHRALEGESLLA